MDNFIAWYSMQRFSCVQFYVDAVAIQTCLIEITGPFYCSVWVQKFSNNLIKYVDCSKTLNDFLSRHKVM